MPGPISSLSAPPSRNQAVARQIRLDDFPGEGIPPIGVPCDLLCEDHVGTYRLPFPCSWTGDHWRNAKTSDAIRAAVVAWRIKGAAGPTQPDSVVDTIVIE